MREITSQNELMAWVMNQFAKKFPRHAVLKGGMSLRLLGSPRSTNDLDYVFIPYRSKKEIFPLLEKALKELEGVRIKAEFHSKMLRILVTYRKYRIQIEADVAEECPSEEMSTAPLAQKASLLPQIARVMRYDVALAHKLAAWNERDLLRDLYDVYFLFSHLQVLPHRPTLETRLKKIHPAKNARVSTTPKSMTLAVFLDKLAARIETLTQNEIENELSAVLNRQETAGLAKRIKTAVFRLIEKMGA